MFSVCKILNKIKLNSDKEGLKILLVHFSACLTVIYLLLIWMNIFLALFLLPSCVLPGLAHRANNFAKGVYI